MRLFRDTLKFKGLSILLLMTILIIALSGCGLIGGVQEALDDYKESVEDKANQSGENDDNHREEEINPNEGLEDFMTFADEIGYEISILSPLGASFTYGDMEAEGLSDLLFEMDAYSAEELEEDMATIRGMGERLYKYDRSDLSDEEQMIYDMLDYQIDVSLKAEDYDYYWNNFKPSFGMQVSLPLALIQMELETKLEFDAFIERIKILPTTFENALAFEWEKVEMDLALQGYLYQLASEQIDQLATTPETFMLYQGFMDQLKGADFLTDNEKEAYRVECLRIVEEDIFPIYEKMSIELEKIGQLSDNKVGTSEFDKAKEYYEWHIYDKTSYEMSVEEMEAFIQDKSNDKIVALQALLEKHPEIVTSLQNGFEFGTVPSMEQALVNQKT